jgi:hypothetical protein
VFDKNIATKFGHWSVCDNKFNDKFEAAIFASKNKQKLNFEFNNNIWEQFDLNMLGKLDLKNLYKLRAQQIRDKYDRVVLYFSGGSDSTNILDTFIDNNIKLDCIYVRWPFEVLDTSLHQANTQDKSAFNFNSEWNFAVKPKLDWIAKYRPDIKIELKSFSGLTDHLNFKDDGFDGINSHYSPVNIIRKTTYSDFERDSIDKGYTVAQVSGIDKPMLHQDISGNVSMRFVDDFFHTMAASSFNPYGVEFFYWTADMPELAYEMAYKVFQYYQVNRDKRHLVPGVLYQQMSKEIKHACREIFFQDVKLICYPTWDPSTFQTEKPKHPFRIDKDFWFFKSSEFEKTKTVWDYHYASRLNEVADNLCEFDPTGKKTGLMTTTTKSFKLGKWV